MDSRTLRSRGYSLIEAILASFLLVFTFFMVSSLFNTGLQYSAKVDGRMTAVRIAQKRLSEIRRWAKDSPNWVGCPVGQDPLYPAYTVTVELRDFSLFGPSSELESIYPGNQRALRTVSKQAVITVTSSRSAPFTLTGIVTRAEGPEPVAIAISGNFATVTPASPATLTATATDASGQPITDVFFHWAVEPFGTDPSSATIEFIRRDGSQVRLRNQVPGRNGVPVPRSGNCKAQAYVRYNGRIWPGETPPIRLVP